MSSILNCINGSDNAPAIVIPRGGPKVSYGGLKRLVQKFQSDLASFGLAPGQAVSVSLPNNLEFVVSFIAIGNQKCIAGKLILTLKKKKKKKNQVYKVPFTKFKLH